MRSNTVPAAALWRRAVLGVCAAAAAMLAPSAASAQQWPEKNITLVVCFPPGGGTDIAARLINIPLGEALGKPVIVENRAGASGNTATQAVARAAPDGYTLLACSSAYVVNPSMFAASTYDPLKDLVPITVIGASPNVFVVAAGSPHKTMKDLIAFAKANPGKLNWTTPGPGTTPFLSGEYVKQKAGLDIVHVPFSGGGPAMQATVAGQVEFYATSFGTAAALVEAGQLRALTVTSKGPFAELPGIPTLIDLGFQDGVFDTFQGIFAPAGTPKPIVERIAAELGRLLKNADTADKLKKSGLTVLAEGPEAFKARVAREVVFYKEIVERGGLKVK